MVNKTHFDVNEGYKITIVGRHVHVTDSMKEYARDKISKIEHFSSRIIDVAVTMDIQKLEHKVDIVMKVDHIKLKVQASSNDMYVSIDKAVGKVIRKLRRYKSQIQDHQAKSISVIDMNVNVIKGPAGLGDIEEINLDIEDENRKALEDEYKVHQIVSQEKRPLKTLSSDEAIMKMDLSGDTFMVFRSEEDLKLKVIYKRADTNYGIIEPE